MIQQHTLRQAVSLSGKGLHSGQSVTVQFLPAPEHHGIQFQRRDLPDQPYIKADADLVVDTLRSTTLANSKAKVSTIEHILAAVLASEIDNITISVDAQEMPIMDGSSLVFMEALQQAGRVAQNAERIVFELDEPLRYVDEKKGTEIIALPADKLQITALVDFDSPVVNAQYATLNDLADFASQIAAARTFCFVHELQTLVQHGLIKGGDLDNAVVVADRDMAAEELQHLSQLLNHPQIEVHKGYLTNTALRFNNEPARHKLLDMVGDFALVGTPFRAQIIANKPGHAANTAFAKILKAHIKKRNLLRDVPVYNPAIPPLYDADQLQKILPHRHPFLLVDKILEITENEVFAVKNVTHDEMFFNGHFPGQAVMPGVLIVEAMAQAGGVMLLSTVPDPENYVTFFVRMNDVKFRKTVVPGDTIVFRLTLTGPIRRGLCEMYCRAYVGTQLTTEGILMAQLVKRR